jgi:spore germination protein GerM
VAERKKPAPKKTAKPSGLGCLFWIAFLIVMVGLFLVNREVIRRTLKSTPLFGQQTEKPAPPKEAEPRASEEPGTTVPVKPAPAPAPAPAAKEPAKSIEPTAGQPEKPADTTPAPSKPPKKPTPAPAAPTPGTQSPVAKPANDTAAPAKPPAVPEKRERSLYFMRVDQDGTIVRVKTVRKIAVSDSPMMDALGALLAGPSAEERTKGLETLIPPGTVLLSATVRGTTAYLSFSEEFQFNHYGIEGYAAQLRQVVWTATEFSTVQDVQILIEGRLLDYLAGDGMWIGSPLSRDTL